MFLLMLARDASDLAVAAVAAVPGLHWESSEKRPEDLWERRVACFGSRNAIREDVLSGRSGYFEGAVGGTSLERALWVCDETFRWRVAVNC